MAHVVQLNTTGGRQARVLVGGFNYVPNCIKMGQSISPCQALPFQGHITQSTSVVDSEPFSHGG
jgi:hypothetical protein